MGKIYNLFQTKTAHLPFFMKEYPPRAPTPRCNLFTYSIAKCYGKESSNMAASSTSVGPATSDVSEEIPPWARGNHLRYVEKEVLIPKIVRERAKAKCDDLIKGKQYRHYNRCHQPDKSFENCTWREYLLNLLKLLAGLGFLLFFLFHKLE